MPLKNLVMGRKSRAAHEHEKPEKEKKEGNPIEKKEDLNETDENPPKEENEIEDEEVDDVSDDEDSEFFEEENATTSQSRKDNSKEALEIMELCDLYGKLDLAKSYIRKGYSAAAVRKHLLAKRNRELKATSQNSVISNRQSARTHSGAGGVVSAVKRKLKIKE